MADDIIINVGSDNEDIQIHPVETVNNINTEVSGDKYYTDLARSWAISDNLVANTDYSSKYYANISKNYAINAELSETNASNSAATAVLKADAANISANNAYIWAEGTDEEIIAIGGTHSSKGWVNYILNNAPTATTTRTATGAIITVSDIIHGVTTSELFDGAKGDKGDKGDKGEKGDTGIKGDTGATGADGFSPIATVEKVGNTATITITDKNGTTTTNIHDGVGAITDVTVNGISVLDGSVAKIDLTDYVDTSTLATTLADYVTNSTLTATLADYALLSDIPTVPTTDQTYNNTSSNPQSGTAVAEAISTKADNSTVNNHINNTSNPHNVTASQVGLGNVDNTSDLNKPISTATQTALDNKANIDLTNINNTAKLVITHCAMPSSVHTVLSVAAPGTAYTAPADGWFYMQLAGSTTERYGVRLYNQTKDYCANSSSYGWNVNRGVWLPCQTGDVVKYTNDGGGITISKFWFIYAVGSESEFV